MQPEPARKPRRKPGRRKPKKPDNGGPPTGNGPTGGDPDQPRKRRPDPGWDLVQQRRPLHWTPWLIVRAHAKDKGQRSLAPSIPFWESPDIWVESSDPAKNAVAGEPNYVHARVFNLGMAPGVPLKVEFYWTDPTLGFSAGSMIWIGTEWVQVEGLHHVVVRCNNPWIPVHLNGGHECLMVHCSNAILDPITQPFQPTLDRHVGQRNITVLQGNPGTTLALPLWVYNPWHGAGQTLVTARAERFSIRTGAEDWRLDRPLLDQLVALSSAPEQLGEMAGRGHTAMQRTRPGGREEHGQRAATTILRQPGQTGPISAKLREGSEILPTRDARSQLAQRLMAAEQFASGGNSEAPALGSRLHAATLDEFERRHLHVEFGVPHDARRGEVIVHRLIQTTNELIAGGHTIVIEVI